MLRKTAAALALVAGGLLCPVTVPQALAVTKTLKNWGVPDFKDHPRQKYTYIDQSDKIPGKETQFAVYEVRGVVIGTFSLGDKLYGVTVDFDRKEPVDLALLDSEGKGEFEKLSPDKIRPPDWTFKVAPDPSKRKKDVNYGGLAAEAARMNPYKHPEAVIDFLGDYRDDPKNNSAQYFLQLGLAYQIQGKTDAALKLFEKGLALKPEDEELIFNLGVSRTWNREYDEARKLFDRYEQMNPGTDRTKKWREYLNR